MLDMNHSQVIIEEYATITSEEKNRLFRDKL